MIPRALLTALLFSTVAVGSVTAAPPEVRDDGPAAAAVVLGVDPDPAVAGLVGWLQSRPLLRGLLLAGAAAVGLVLAHAGYRRIRDRYRMHTSPTVVLLDDLEEFEWDDAVSDAADGDDAETDNREP